MWLRDNKARQTHTHIHIHTHTQRSLKKEKMLEWQEETADTIREGFDFWLGSL